jgi:hypothetical protein
LLQLNRRSELRLGKLANQKWIFLAFTFFTRLCDNSLVWYSQIQFHKHKVMDFFTYVQNEQNKIAVDVGVTASGFLLALLVNQAVESWNRLLVEFGLPNRNTIISLGLRVGETCTKLVDAKMRGLSCKHIEIDEIWGFVGAKRQNAERVGAYGDVWTFVALGADSKLIPSFIIGKRDS